MRHIIPATMTFPILVVAGLLGSPAVSQTLPPTAVVDYHQHLFSPAITNGGATRPAVSAKELIPLLDAAGIRQALVLSLAYQYGNPNRPPVENEYQKVRAENDWTSGQVAQYPDRLRGFCSINPLKDYALDEIARCGKDEHLRRGLKLHFGNSDVDLSNRDHVARLKQVFALANRQQMAIVVHMRASVTMKREYGASRARAFLDEVLPAAPDVPVQIAHLGGAGGYNDPGADEVHRCVRRCDRQEGSAGETLVLRCLGRCRTRRLAATGSVDCLADRRVGRRAGAVWHRRRRRSEPDSATGVGGVS